MSPQKENGYTPIANELFEAFYRCKLLEYERVVVMCVWRKTYGWSKKEDWVSNSQLSNETGIAKSHITRTIKQLTEKGIIKKSGKRISVNKYYDQWVVEWRKLPHQVTKVTSPGNKKLPHQVPTKAIKQNTKTISAQSAEEGLETNNQDMSWKERRYADDYEVEPVQVDPDYKKPVKKKVSNELQELFNLFSDNPAHKAWYLWPKEREAGKILLEAYGIETLKKRVARIKDEAKNNDPLFPLITSPSQLLEKMPNVERYFKI